MNGNHGSENSESDFLANNLIDVSHKKNHSILWEIYLVIENKGAVTSEVD